MINRATVVAETILAVGERFNKRVNCRLEATFKHFAQRFCEANRPVVGNITVVPLLVDRVNDCFTPVRRDVTVQVKQGKQVG